MKPAEHDEVGLVRGDRAAPARGPTPRGLVVLDPEHEGRDAGPLGAGQALDAVAVGADGDHAGAVRRVGAGVEQGLEVGAGAGDEDDEARGCEGWARAGV